MDDHLLNKEMQKFWSLVKAVKNEDPESKLAKDFSSEDDASSEHMPDTKWKLKDISFGNGHMCVLDYPFRKPLHSERGGKKLHDLLSKSVSIPRIQRSFQGVDNMIFLASEIGGIVQIHVSYHILPLATFTEFLEWLTTYPEI